MCRVTSLRLGTCRIRPFIPDINIAPLQETYSEAFGRKQRTLRRQQDGCILLTWAITYRVRQTRWDISEAQHQVGNSITLQPVSIAMLYSTTGEQRNNFTADQHRPPY